MNLEIDSFDYPLPQIRSMGNMLIDPVWAERMHLSYGLEIIHLIKGEIELQTANTSHHAHSKETLMIPAGTQHRDQFDTAKDVHIFFCSITWSADAQKKYFAQVNNDTLLNMSTQIKNDISGIFNGLEIDLQSGTFIDSQVSRYRIQLILMLAMREAIRQSNDNLTDKNTPSFGQQRKKSLLEQAKKYILQHYQEPISLNQVADALRVSGYYLSHVFSEKSNLSLFSFLTTVRMERAQELLTQGKLNVSEVAKAVGYSNANYFSKTFRKYCGCSPREFATKKLKSQHPPASST